MDTSTSALREQGIQALRQGNTDGAVDLLARAVMADGQDADAQAFLGVAYSQKGLHAQAKRALQTAVDLQPRNASFQYNLGVALEQAGDRAGAASSYRAAFHLNPEHAQARARLQSLEAPPAVPPTAAPSHATPAAGAPWLSGPAQNAAELPGGPPGTAQCPHCKQWSKPGLSCEWCSASLRHESGRTSSAVPGSDSASPGAAPKRPFGVSLVVVFYDLAAICSIIISFSLGSSIARMFARPGDATAGAVMATFVAASIVMSLVMVTISYFLWKGYNWARIVIMVLLALAMLGQVVQVLAGPSPVLPLLELAVSALFLFILSTRRTREFCSR
jgi:Tetratricopeptide repeat